MPEESVLIEGSDGKVERFPPSTFVVFIDDTGEPSLSDPRHPVFGLGGCGAMASELGASVEEPWREMKRLHFGGPDVPLHAADFSRPEGKPSPEQLDAFGRFFGRGNFFRFAAVATTMTRPNGLPIRGLVIQTLMDTIRVCAQELPVSMVLVCFEASERDGEEMRQRLASYTALFRSDDRQRWPVSARAFPVPKGRGGAGLEVADFIVHTAGTRARHHALTGKRPERRRDFEAMFGGESKGRAYYRELSRVEMVPRQPRPADSPPSRQWLVPPVWPFNLTLLTPSQRVVANRPSADCTLSAGDGHAAKPFIEFTLAESNSAIVAQDAHSMLGDLSQPASEFARRLVKHLAYAYNGSFPIPAEGGTAHFTFGRREFAVTHLRIAALQFGHEIHVDAPLHILEPSPHQAQGDSEEWSAPF